MSIDVRLGDNRLIRFLPDSLKEKIKIYEVERNLDGLGCYIEFYNCRYERDREDPGHSPTLADVILVDDGSTTFHHPLNVLIMRPCTKHVQAYLDLYKGEVWEVWREL